MSVEAGQVIGFLCPACQTPEENAEAEVNTALLEYVGRDHQGRLIGRLKEEQ